MGCSDSRLLKFTQTSKKTGEVYECRIWLDDKKKLILKMDCSCWNFQNKRIKKIGKVFTIKFRAEPCKHLAHAIDALQYQGYLIQPVRIHEGSDKCTAEIRRGVIMACKGMCNFENCEETEHLQIHRQIPGYLGGKYSLMNCVALCPKHHKLIHQREFT